MTTSQKLISYFLKWFAYTFRIGLGFGTRIPFTSYYILLQWQHVYQGKVYNRNGFQIYRSAAISDDDAVTPEGDVQAASAAYTEFTVWFLDGTYEEVLAETLELADEYARSIWNDVEMVTLSIAF